MDWSRLNLSAIKTCIYKQIYPINQNESENYINNLKPWLCHGFLKVDKDCFESSTYITNSSGKRIQVLKEKILKLALQL